MATLNPSKFDVTPEQQASIPRFMYQQLTFKPEAITDIDLKGKTAIVTGSNTGVGFETARQLLDLGVSKLILAVRNEEKGAAAKVKLSEGRGLPKDGTGTTIEVWKLDLSDYDTVVSFAARAEKELSTLDIAILNAGVLSLSQSFNKNTGHDEVIQVNYLSTALLTILLLPVFKSKRASQSGPSRMSIVSSEVAGWTNFKESKPLPSSILGALDDKSAKVDMTDRMMVSKLLQHFFLVELAKIVPASLVQINAVSPGTVYGTEFDRDRTGLSGAIFQVMKKRLANPPPVGARMITDAAVRHGEDVHGEFLSFQKMVPSV